MTIYLDVIWLLNLIIDGMIIYLTAWVLKRKLTWVRLSLGSFVASMIIFLLFTPVAAIVYHPLGKIGYSMFVVWIVFGFRRFASFVQAFFMFYFIAFSMGGGLFGLHYLLSSNAFYADFLRFSTLKYGDPISWGLILIGLPIMVWFAKKRMDHVVVRKFRRQQTADVLIQIEGNEIRAKGFVDTGNNLYHPVNRAPVIFINQEACEQKIPKELFHQYAAECLTEQEVPEHWPKKLTLIPFRGVGGTSEYVVAVKPDTVQISIDGNCFEIKKLYVAFSKDSFSVEKDFNCILHPDTIHMGKLIGTAS